MRYSLQGHILNFFPGAVGAYPKLCSRDVWDAQYAGAKFSIWDFTAHEGKERLCLEKLEKLFLFQCIFSLVGS